MPDPEKCGTAAQSTVPDRSEHTPGTSGLHRIPVRELPSVTQNHAVPEAA